MTHSHRHDFAVLEQVLRQPLAYVGFMGSRRKIATARERMLEAGIPESALDAVHMPIGLDIKAETPEEIAVSIAAECILHRQRAKPCRWMMATGMKAHRGVPAKAADRSPSCRGEAFGR